MVTDYLLPFIGVALTLVLSPGPDTILILKNTIHRGRLAGWLTMVGVQLGVFAHTILAVVGLSAIVYSSKSVFNYLATIGAFYLMWLGYQFIFKSNIFFHFDQKLDLISHKKMFLQGLFSNLLNPKVLILFVVLMPNFIDLSIQPHELQIATLGLVLLMINIPFQILLVVLAYQFSIVLGNQFWAKIIQTVLGIILIAFAVDIFIFHVME